MQNFTYKVTCCACPLQIEGTIDGVEFYFRSRGETWRMGIGGDPVVNPIWSMSGPWGNGPYEAGYMPEKEGLKIVKACCRLYKIAALNCFT